MGLRRALTKLGGAALAICALLGSAPARGNLIVNGDFNAGMPSPASPTACDSTNPPGWTMTPNFDQPTVFHCRTSEPVFEGFWFRAGNTAENGPGIIAFNAGDRPALGTLSQTFGTVPGAQYTLEFDYGVTGFLPVNQQSLAVTVLGSDSVAVLFDNVVTDDTNNPADPTDNSLTQHVFVFTADGAQATIRFSDVPANATVSLDGVLDNVSVVGPAPVPEPPTLALLGAALAGLGWSRRGRRTSTNLQR